MLIVRRDFPHLSPLSFIDDALSSADRQFHREIIALVKERSTRKQLGQKFDGYQLVVDGENKPLAIEFRFLGTNSHGAHHTVGPFMRDIIAELRAKRGLKSEPRPKDMLGEL